MSIECLIEGFEVSINLADTPENQIYANDVLVRNKIAELAFEGDLSGFINVNIGGKNKTISWELLSEENIILKDLFIDEILE